jgi:general secretion pathway protein E
MNAVTSPASAASARHEGPLNLRQLIEWLAKDRVISPEEAKRTLTRCAQAESRQPPLVRLANVAMTRQGDGKPLDLELLTEWLAGRAGLAYLRIDPLRVDVGKVADTMSAAYAERHKVLPVQVTPAEVVVATAEPFLTDWIAEVERQARRPVRRVVANPTDIQRYTAEFFSLAKSVRAAQKAGGNAGSASFEQLVELGKSNKQLDANDQSVVQVVDWLWQYAFDQRASDIHLEPRREQGVIRFRIDGVLHPAYQMPMGVMNAMVARIKLLGRMDVVEKRRPLDGRIKTRNMRGDEVEMRLSTLPTAFGEKMVMRIFDPDTAVKDLDALGFAQHDAQRWEQLVTRPHGIILVTGPTGSGKTTTLYSTLKRVATEEVNVSTVEDPIEMIEPSFNQTQVQPQLDFGFIEGLRALMRQDPDIIMVGEVRDLATAEMAVQAADRSPGLQHPAHQRCAQRHHAADGAGRAQLPDQRHHAGRAGAAPCSHPVPALQGARRERHARAARRLRQALADHRLGARLQAGRLCRLPHDGLPRPHGSLRTAHRQRALQGAGRQGAQRGRAAAPGRGRRHAAAAPRRRPARGRRADHRRRSPERHAAARVGQGARARAPGKPWLHVRWYPHRS